MAANTRCASTTASLCSTSAGTPRSDRPQEGLRPRPVRVLHRAARRPARHHLPCLRVATTAPRSSPPPASATDRRRAAPGAQAFLDHDGFQCGYCTPGQICSAVGMLDEAQGRSARAHVTDGPRRQSPELTDDEIRERMSGNLCRCAAYPNIVAAASRRRRPPDDAASTYHRADRRRGRAVTAVADRPDAVFLGGGTNSSTT